MYMDDIKLFAKYEKQFETPKTGSENIQSVHRDGICHLKMIHTNKERQETTYDRRNVTAKPRKK